MNELNDDWLSWPPEAIDEFFYDAQPIDVPIIIPANIKEEQHLPQLILKEPGDACISKRTL